MNNNALVEILLPVYNGSKYLEQQLESLLNQTYANIRIIIRDDVSSDGSCMLIQHYEDQFPDKIKVIDSNINLGSSLSFHELLKYSTAEYVMFCDQDDVWLSNKVQDSISAITDNNLLINTIRCIFTDLKIVDEKLNLLHCSMRRALNLKYLPKDYKDFLCQSQVTGCTMMINRSAVELLLKFPPPSRKIIHDHWYSVILAIYGEIRYIDKPTILYRQHFGNQVGVKSVNLKYFARKVKSLLEVYRYDMLINNALPAGFRVNHLFWCVIKMKLNLRRLI